MTQSIPLFDEWLSIFQIQINQTNFARIYTNWIDNHKFIEYTNAQNLTYSLGHNQYSGMSHYEFMNYMGLYNYFKSSSSSNRVKNGHANFINELPDSVDWVEYGVVTSVKDQGQCGSCWSFSAIGALESAYYIETGILRDFSEQQLVDCDRLRYGGKDHGCNGGLMENAFAWIGQNDGICSEQDYPYVSGTTMKEGNCNTHCENIAGTDVFDYVDVTPSSDTAMMNALLEQPISVGIEADQREFQLYKSGVFTGNCGTNIDHGVLLVGYGTDTKTGLDYYKIKNSWGASWGEEGYIRIGRGKEYNHGDGQCGVLLEGIKVILMKRLERILLRGKD
jgi:hypothetical protein